MTPIFPPYAQLVERTREIGLLASAATLLNWDRETYMPAKALPYRADQLSYLAGRTHALFSAPEVGDWLSACEDHGFSADSDEAANVRRWRWEYDRATKLPARLVEEFAHAKAHAHESWVRARRQSEFSVFQPALEKILTLGRRMADCWGYAASPYDALLDEYESGARSEELAAVFANLRPTLVELLGPAAERSRRIPEDLLRGEYPIERQAALNREVVEALGFDFQAGRIDTTAHPFCTTPGPGDCRLTTRYDVSNFAVSFYGVLHEGGHGMYEQGLRPEAYGTPVGAFSSLGIHESQSRLWENQVGRAPEFWEHWLPRVAHHFPHLARRNPEEITAAVNRVAPSFIRVEADELTYDLHVVLRFEIERALLAGDLAVSEVPGAWNERFEKYLGLKVPDDARGCLQDVHWSAGLIGYFPTYSLGNLNAAQLTASARAERPEIDDELRAGRYGSLLGWLREKVHRQGQRLLPRELIAAATGRPTEPADYVAYLRKKFA